MRSDLDRLMAERHIDAFIIPPIEAKSTPRDYLTGGAKADAVVVKKQGEVPILIVNLMEREEAAKSGLAVMTYDDFNVEAIYRQHGRGTRAAWAAIWLSIFEKLSLQGRVTFYGMVDIQRSMGLLRVVQERLGGHVEVILDELPDIFDLAYETKDAEELEKMRDVGRRASEVMRVTRDWLSSHRAVNGQIVNVEGKPLTIGAVKRYVRYQLLERDLEHTKDMIFAQGRDCGLPHSVGESDEILRPGESLIFDLFPRCLNTSYYHDTTRTWSLGYAREELERDFQTVRDIYFRSLEGILLGRPTHELGKQVCEWFEAAGHATRLNTPQTQEGYIHALGHGLGLEVHESPTIGHNTIDSMIFRAGNMVTIEPGLYYPSKGYGVRIEDTVYVDEAGQIHNLTDCPYDLVIPLQA
jgi:Xaa-Pro aminopeptidase